MKTSCLHIQLVWVAYKWKEKSKKYRSGRMKNANANLLIYRDKFARSSSHPARAHGEYSIFIHHPQSCCCFVTKCIHYSWWPVNSIWPANCTMRKDFTLSFSLFPKKYVSIIIVCHILWHYNGGVFFFYNWSSILFESFVWAKSVEIIYPALEESLTRQAIRQT